MSQATDENSSSSINMTEARHITSQIIPIGTYGNNHIAFSDLIRSADYLIPAT